MLLIGIVVILLFGPNKIPELARSAGKFMGEFTRAQREVEMEYTNSKE
ncbi:MAG: twin-arginine translocase TatA/TatE family subunit, partial [Halobacteriota archaeon]|nr:twin-arginine translocase TatA/TatE family subunit [Halobacteriota archaeon]